MLRHWSEAAMGGGGMTSSLTITQIIASITVITSEVCINLKISLIFSENKGLGTANVYLGISVSYCLLCFVPVFVLINTKIISRYWQQVM